MVRRLLRQLKPRQAPTPPPPASLDYRVQYSGMASEHLPITRTVPVPSSFLEERRHIFDGPSKVTNHDPLAFWLFTRLLDDTPGDEVTIVEFGVWRASWLENLAIHADHTGRTLRIVGYDTFDTFPDCAGEHDLEGRRESFKGPALAANAPLGTDDVRARLAPYRSVVDLDLVAGDVMEPDGRRFDAGIVHYDLDYYLCFRPAMDRIASARWLVVDDYYQPSWTGIVPAVNEWGAEHGRWPVNLADWYRVERSARATFIDLLVEVPSANW